MADARPAASARGFPKRPGHASGEPLHLLAIGDSIIAGVGARRIQQSTVGHVARFMSGRLAREINWYAAGMIGAGARRVRRDVVPALPAQRFDAILLSVGVNDVLKLERSGRFRRQLLKLVRDLRVHSPDAVSYTHLRAHETPEHL